MAGEHLVGNGQEHIFEASFPGLSRGELGSLSKSTALGRNEDFPESRATEKSHIQRPKGETERHRAKATFLVSLVPWSPTQQTH